MRNESAGRLPLRSFLGNDKVTIDERLYKDGGIKPESSFAISPSKFKLLNLPKASGMCPPKAL